LRKLNPEGIVTRQAADPLNVKILGCQAGAEKKTSSVLEFVKNRKLHQVISEIAKMREALTH
jgi:hypothetical protein